MISKKGVTFGAAIVMRHLQLKTIHLVQPGPRLGPLQAAGTAVADARLIFSGQPKARRTPELAPGSCWLLAQQKPGLLLYLVHHAVTVPGARRRRRTGHSRPHIPPGNAGGGRGGSGSAGPRFPSNYSRGSWRAGGPDPRGQGGLGLTQRLVGRVGAGWTRRRHFRARPRPSPAPPPARPAAGSRGSTCVNRGAGSWRSAVQCGPGKSSRMHKYGRGVSHGSALETTARFPRGRRPLRRRLETQGASSPFLPLE